jgi:hypothetical protein
VDVLDGARDRPPPDGGRRRRVCQSRVTTICGR